MSEQNQQTKKCCPRCGSSSIVRRGYRYTKSMVVPLFQCYGCGRSFSFLHAGYGNCFRFKKGTRRPESHREAIRAGIKRFYDSHKGYIPASAWKKGHIPFSKGKHLSEQHRKRDSESHIGHIGFFKGRHHTEKARASLRARWHNETFIRNWVRGLKLRPNKPERLLDSILQSLFPNEFKYIGDGKLFIDGLCPDFVNCNGKKQLIELFGERFHDPLKTFREHIPYRQTERGRIEAFAKYGYSTLIIWQHELGNLEKLKERITAFAASGIYRKNPVLEVA